MKYLSLVLALCLSISITTHAATNPTKNLRATVTTTATKTLEVTLVNLQQQRTNIMIQSIDGTVVYFKDIVKKHNGYRKKLNLTDLKAGRYLLIVENSDEKLQQVILVKEDNTLLLSSLK